MASKAFTCCASTLFSNTRASSPLLVGWGPCLDLSPGSSKAPSSKHSLVVRAQLQGGGRVIDPLGQKGSAYTPKNVALLETSPYGRYSSSSTNLLTYIVRTPWNTSEDETEIKMWFDMPELKPENIQVNVVDDLLVINGDDGNDNNGQGKGSNIVRPYDSIIELPSNCWKEQITAVFKNGVLYIKVPKITKIEQRVINIPVKNV